MMARSFSTWLTILSIAAVLYHAGILGCQRLEAQLSSPTPCDINIFKGIGNLINSSKADWVKVFGKPDEEDLPGGADPDAAGECDWDFGTLELDVEWKETAAGPRPSKISFWAINGSKNLSLAEMDRIARFFGLHLSKSDEGTGQYEWEGKDNSIGGEYDGWDVPPKLYFIIETPGAAHNAREACRASKN
jgi:hypothetical protein